MELYKSHTLDINHTKSISYYIRKKKWNEAMVIAIKEKKYDIINFLLEKGADNLDEFLKISVQNNELNLIHKFVKLDADLTPGIDTAIITNNMKFIEIFISYGMVDWNECLLTAAMVGNIQLIKFFIDKGADNQNAAIINSVSNGHIDAVKFFIECLKCQDFQEYVHIAIQNDQISLVNFIITEYLPTYNNNIGLKQAAYYGKINMVKYFVKNGANAFNEHIEDAVHGGNLDLVKYFIDCGVRDFFEILCYASEFGKFDIVKFIFFNMECNAQNVKENGMMRAVRGENMNIINFFIEHGAKDWNFALARGVCGEGGCAKMEMIEFLIDKGASDWNWALTQIIERNDIKLVKFFIDKGATHIKLALKRCKEMYNCGYHEFEEMIEYFENLIGGIYFKPSSTETDFNCTICCNGTNNKSIVKTTKCNHQFHKKCLDLWLSGQQTCPLCRTNLIK